MTIRDAIRIVDSLQNNTYSIEQKIDWLNDLECCIRREIVDTHEGGPAAPFVPFTPDTPLDTQLTAPSPYDDVYLLRLQEMIDYYNGDIERFNNSSNMRRSVYASFASYYNRTYMPKGHNIKYV